MFQGNITYCSCREKHLLKKQVVTNPGSSIVCALIMPVIIHWNMIFFVYADHLFMSGGPCNLARKYRKNRPGGDEEEREKSNRKAILTLQLEVSDLWIIFCKRGYKLSFLFVQFIIHTLNDKLYRDVEHVWTLIVGNMLNITNIYNLMPGQHKQEG